MSTTTYQAIEKPSDREQFLEIFFQSRLEEIGTLFGYAHIEGLQLEWVSTSSIKVKTGAADLPDKSRRLRVAADITVSSISLGNNVWGHAYLYSNAGVAAVEVVTTAPELYFGTAYRKTGDTTRRYLGSVRTNGSGQIYKFQMQGNDVRYLEDSVSTPFRVLSNGTAAAETSVSCVAVVPVTARRTSVRLTNAATNAGGYAAFGASDDTITLPAAMLLAIASNFSFFGVLYLDSAQAFTYAYNTAPTGGGLYVDVLSYTFER